MVGILLWVPWCRVFIRYFQTSLSPLQAWVLRGGYMTIDFVTGVMAETIRITLLISAPVLIVGLVVGVFVSLVQAVTQVQEMTLVFVPKIVACLIALVAALPWMMNVLMSFTINIFNNIPTYAR